MKQCVFPSETLSRSVSPVIFLCKACVCRLCFYFIVFKDSLYQFLISRLYWKLFAEKSIIFCTTELSQKCPLKFLCNRIRHRLIKVFDAPCKRNFLRAAKMVARLAVFGVTLRIDNINKLCVCGQFRISTGAQTFRSLRTRTVLAERILIRHIIRHR